MSDPWCYRTAVVKVSLPVHDVFRMNIICDWIITASPCIGIGNLIFVQSSPPGCQEKVQNQIFKQQVHISWHTVHVCLTDLHSCFIFWACFVLFRFHKVCQINWKHKVANAHLFKWSKNVTDHYLNHCYLSAVAAVFLRDYSLQWSIMWSIH